MVVHSGIHVFVNNKKVNLLSNKITSAELISKAGFGEPKHWDLYRLQSETDSSGGTIVAASDVIKVKDGDWFRVIEGHHTSE